jgi:hypothetical protein
MVTYEAAGADLAAIVSPMGAGRIVRNGEEGYVIAPFERETWLMLCGSSLPTFP